jgi:phage shock protein PspC (stress-responsive transcriptional regulator)
LQEVVVKVFGVLFGYFDCKEVVVKVFAVLFGYFDCKSLLQKYLMFWLDILIEKTLL